MISSVRTCGAYSTPLISLFGLCRSKTGILACPDRVPALRSAASRRSEQFEGRVRLLDHLGPDNKLMLTNLRARNSALSVHFQNGNFEHPTRMLVPNAIREGHVFSHGLQPQPRDRFSIVVPPGSAGVSPAFSPLVARVFRPEARSGAFLPLRVRPPSTFERKIHSTLAPVLADPNAFLPDAARC